MRDVFYLSHDNPVVWQLTLNKTVPDHTAITKLLFNFELGDEKNTTVKIDSTTENTLVATTTSDITIKPFNLSPSAKANFVNGNYMLQLVVFDASNPNGIVWFDGRPVKVVI